MTIKHISFDVWNTLITANPSYAAARSVAIASIAGITFEQAKEAYAVVKKQLDAEAEQFVCGDVARAWGVLGIHLGLTADQRDNLQTTCENLFRAFPPILNPDLVDQLMYLAVDHEMSIKSNTNFISGKLLSEVVGFDRMPWWSFTHFSDDWWMCKPDIIFFAATWLESKDDSLRKDEILHVGDSKIFDGKCVDAGFKFCHIKNPQDLLEKLEKGEIINA